MSTPEHPGDEERRWYRARWILPSAGPAIENGGLCVAGTKIIELADHPPSLSVDLGDVIVLPGFVNAHTHLDLSTMDGNRPATSSFTDWIGQVVAHRCRVGGDELNEAIERGVRALVASGTTLVGDISSQGDSRDALTRAGLSGVVFREVLGLQPRRYEPLWSDALEFLKSAGTGAIRSSMSPHAPFSTSKEIFRRTAALNLDAPAATHWMETSEEREFLRNGSGPIRELLEGLGALNDLSPTDRPAIDELWNNLSVGGSWILVHGNCLTDEDIARLAAPPLRGRISGIVYCPRTHEYFGRGEHPWRQLLACGISVGLGTDSLASNPDLSVYEEARFLAHRRPEVPAQTILEMATRMGALVLGRSDETGVLAAGKFADLTVIEPAAVPSRDNAASACLEMNSRVAGVMANGQWLAAVPEIEEKLANAEVATRGVLE